MRKNKENKKEYGILITYSWGDEEPEIYPFPTVEAAFTRACEMAGKEAYIQNEEREDYKTATVFVDPANLRIDLRYDSDGEYAYYRVVEHKSPLHDKEEATDELREYLDLCQVYGYEIVSSKDCGNAWDFTVKELSPNGSTDEYVLTVLDSGEIFNSNNMDCIETMLDDDVSEDFEKSINAFKNRWYYVPIPITKDANEKDMDIYPEEITGTLGRVLDETDMSGDLQDEVQDLYDKAVKLL